MNKRLEGQCGPELLARSFFGLKLQQNGWFIPQRTGLHDPTILTYLGLQGQENRRKLAEMFLWPTTFADYCSQVSNSTCTEDDGTASRPPVDESEGERYFVEGVYTGHFRNTDMNDCDLNPTTCVGKLSDGRMDSCWMRRVLTFPLPQATLRTTRAPGGVSAILGFTILIWRLSLRNTPIPN